MYILNFGLDENAFKPESVTSSRLIQYGGITKGFNVIIPTSSKKKTVLSPHVTVHGTGGSNKLVRLVRLYFLARTYIKEGKCDVITTHDPYFMSLTGYLLVWQYHLGFEIQILGVEKLNWIRERILRFVLRRAGSIRVNSKRLVDRVMEFGAPRERIRLVYIYVDVSSFGLDRDPDDPKEAMQRKQFMQSFKDTYGGCFNFLTVSRLVTIKNIPLQVRALNRLIEKYPHVRLHVVGPDSEERVHDALTKLAKELGVEKQVILHGPKYKAELGAYYLSCDCFLLTSFSEGWGMVTTEAASAGLPIIMTDVGSAGELVIDGRSGVVIPVGDEDALTAAMERIATDHEYRKKLIAGSKEILDSLPTFEELLVEYKASWQHALNRKL